MREAALPEKQRSNRRSARRHKPCGTIECRKGSVGLGPNLAVALLDISETGLRMLAKTVFQKGEDVEITLVSKRHARPLRMMADVAWCVEAADGQYCVGLSFRRRLMYMEFQNLT